MSIRKDLREMKEWLGWEKMGDGSWYKPCIDAKELYDQFQALKRRVEDLGWQMSGFGSKMPLFDQIKAICEFLEITLKKIEKKAIDETIVIKKKEKTK